MFGRIQGQRLLLAKMYIANYCAALYDQAGSINIYHVISRINEEFKLVPQNEIELLATDIQYFYDCIQNQQVTSIDRGSYWKWRAMPQNVAEQELINELTALES